jgi:hypothetical protein
MTIRMRSATSRSVIRAGGGGAPGRFGLGLGFRFGFGFGFGYSPSTRHQSPAPRGQSKGTEAISSRSQALVAGQSCSTSYHRTRAIR